MTIAQLLLSRLHPERIKQTLREDHVKVFRLAREAYRSDCCDAEVVSLISCRSRKTSYCWKCGSSKNVKNLRFLEGVK